MAIPTLTMIPSGYKAQKVYSVLPTNGDGDFTFDRNNAGTRVNKDGLIEQVATDVPRLDYSDGSCPSLLLEPSSLNLALYSEDFSQWWQKTNSTVTTNQTTSPSGDLTADKLQRTSTTYNYLRKGISKDSKQLNMTISIFVKQGEGDFFAIRGQGDYPNRIDAIYQFSTNELNTSVGGNNFTVINSSVEEHINGWVRLSISFNTDDYHSFGIYFSPRNTSGFIDHNDSSSSSFVYIWGAQLEEQRYATSYIPTTSETASRSAETFSNDFSSQPTVANTNTVLLKFIPMGFSNDFDELLRFSDGTNEIALEGFQNNNYDVYGSGLVGGGMVDGALSLDAGSINTISFSYSGTSLRFSHNGSTMAINTPTGNLPTITEVSHSVGGLSPIKILELRVYNDFKTQEELNTLTI